MRISIALIFNVEDVNDNIGILKDFSAIVVLSEIDDKALDFFFQLIHKLTGLNLEKEIS